MREKELIVYKDFGEDGALLADMVWLMEHYGTGEEGIQKESSLLYECMHGLLEMAGSHGFSGNLWHCYLTNLLVNNENSYSRACEIRGAVEGTINEAVLHDIAIFKEFFDYDFTDMMDKLEAPAFSMALSYEGNMQESKVYNTPVSYTHLTLPTKA